MLCTSLIGAKEPMISLQKYSKILTHCMINSTSPNTNIPEQQKMTKYHYQHQHQPPHDQKNLHDSQ
jgi:hypothetical protein